MTETDRLDYFLFPHMTLSANSLEKLCVFLPRLDILEILSRATIPEWARDRIYGHAVLSGDKLLSRISDCLQGYRDFANVRGGPGGMLGYLKQALEDIDEPRYRIQEELRGKIPHAKDDQELEIVQAALFLEMARELDEKELEIESGYDRLNVIEQEFRDILGIEEEDTEQVGPDLSEALFHDENSLLYMLGKRIESWLRMLSSGPVVNPPVFVAAFPEVVEQVLDTIRTELERSGKEFFTALYRLGPLPRSQGLSRTLPDTPGLSEIASSCRHGLDDFLRSAARNEETEEKRNALNTTFEELCARCGTPEDAKATLLVTVVKNIPVAAIPGLPSLPLGAAAESWPPIFLSCVAGQ
ncbi:MAG: hypothetical protein P4L55_08740 [Syntrophobacteraceae bacterium]|nr:hypothetical protein [Syntrophobacteraceae bacterium]